MIRRLSALSVIILQLASQAGAYAMAPPANGALAVDTSLLALYLSLARQEAIRLLELAVDTSRVDTSLLALYLGTGALVIGTMATTQLLRLREKQRRIREGVERLLALS